MKDQEQRFMARVMTYYTTTGKLRDLIDACEEYYAQLERQELRKSRLKITALNTKHYMTDEEYEENYLNPELR